MHSTQETASHGVYTAKQTPLFSQFGLINQLIASGEVHAARGIGMGMHRQGCRQGIDRSGLYLGIAVHEYDDVMAFAFHAKHEPVPRPRFATGMELMNMDIGASARGEPGPVGRSIV